MITLIDKNKLPFQAIHPLDAKRYLIADGWSEFVFSHPRNVASFFRDINGSSEQIDLPLHPEYSDFREMMFSLCQKLSNLKGLSILDVFEALSNPDADILYIHRSGNNVKNGEISFEDGIQLFKSAKKLIVNAALDNERRQAYRTLSSIPSGIKNYVSSCKLGQTRIGSYAVSIICPLSLTKISKFEQTSLLPDTSTESENLGRNIVSKVISSAADVNEKLNKNEPLSTLFESEKEDFVSVNYMETLSEIGAADNEASVSLNAQFTPLDTKNIPTSREPKLTSQSFDCIRKTVDSVKNSYSATEKTITGLVSEIRADPIKEERHSGLVTIVYGEIGSKNQVVAELNEDDYYKAIQAHENGKTITVCGHMVSSRRMSAVLKRK